MDLRLVPSLMILRRECPSWGFAVSSNSAMARYSSNEVVVEVIDNQGKSFVNSLNLQAAISMPILFCEVIYYERLD